jgi:hypothetical protein
MFEVLKISAAVLGASLVAMLILRVLVEVFDVAAKATNTNPQGG